MGSYTLEKNPRPAANQLLLDCPPVTTLLLSWEETGMIHFKAVCLLEMVLIPQWNYTVKTENKAKMNAEERGELLQIPFALPNDKISFCESLEVTS